MHLLGEDDVDVDVVQRLGAGWGGPVTFFWSPAFPCRSFFLIGNVRDTLDATL